MIFIYNVFWTKILKNKCSFFNAYFKTRLLIKRTVVCNLSQINPFHLCWLKLNSAVFVSPGSWERLIVSVYVLKAASRVIICARDARVLLRVFRANRALLAVFEFINGSTANCCLNGRSGFQFFPTLNDVKAESKKKVTG